MLDPRHTKSVRAISVPPSLECILEQTEELSQSYLVGGCVRDACMGFELKDLDVEVFGVTYEQLTRGLGRWGRTDLVGQSFGVVKLRTSTGLECDFSIPRRDRKVGPGHKGFETSFDPGITPREAASRRDFTMNALMYEPRRRELMDFFGGLDDINTRTLRHTSDAFGEDPLRVLRGMQFASRFDLLPAVETIRLCKEIKNGFHELAVERVGGEWLKWAARAVRPSVGLRFLAATEWMDHFAEIRALCGTPQDPEWHPEGDVFAHTCHCCDALASMPEWRQSDETSRVVYMLATLTHDFGKPGTTRTAMKDGRERIVSPGHEQEGVPLAQEFLDRINVPDAMKRRILPLIANHLAHLQEHSQRSVRRLARRLEPESITGLSMLVTADSFGRPPMPAVPPPGLQRLRDIAGELALQESGPKPILQGRHLLAFGMSPGPAFTPLLNAAFEAQLDGAFEDVPGALEWLRRHL